MVLRLAMLVPRHPCSGRPLAPAMRRQVASIIALSRSSLKWKSSSCCRRASRWLRARLKPGDYFHLLPLKTVSMPEIIAYITLLFCAVKIIFMHFLRSFYSFADICFHRRHLYSFENICIHFWRDLYSFEDISIQSWSSICRPGLPLRSFLFRSPI